MHYYHCFVWYISYEQYVIKYILLFHLCICLLCLHIIHVDVCLYVCIISDYLSLLCVYVCMCILFVIIYMIYMYICIY